MTDPLDRLREALADRYAIERELGAGGMATVYLAEDLKHRRKVALKVLRAELTAELGTERFLREIETTANLRHPHIVPLYDSGEAAGLLFYVMPLVEGESLRDRLDREKQLPIDDALRIAREVADALSYAHAHGVIHRDIKPANVLLESGHAVVTDFGIAKAVGAVTGRALTMTGLSIGTPHYMSPEQAAGDGAVDGRSDVYALGCMLYEMLAGEPPFTGPTAESVVRQHLGAAPPSITQLRPTVPPAIAVALERSLAKNPADRFSPVVQFAEALGSTGVPPAGAGRRRWGPLAAVLAAAIVVTAGITWWLRGPSGEPAVPVIGATSQLSRDPGLEIDPGISPDGQFVAYAAGPVTRMQIVVRQVAGGGRAVVLSTDSSADHRWPRWSPDGSQIAYQASEGVYVVPALGGVPRLVSRTPQVFTLGGAYTPISGLSWSPDGGQLAFATSHGETEGVRVVDLATGDTTALVSPREANSPAWSPDGRWIAVVAGNMPFTFGTVYFANAGISTLWLVRPDGGAPIRLTDGDALDLSPQWLPDGRSLLFVSDRGGSRDLYRLQIDGDGAPVGPPQRVTTGLDAHSISVARASGHVAYARLRSTSNIWSMPVPERGPVSARGAVPVTSGSQIIERFDVTADGAMLAFDSDRDGRGDIYTMSTVGGEALRVTTDSVAEFSPSWSPAGRRIAFHAILGGNRELFTINADGTDRRRRTNVSTQELDASWAPTGDRLVAEVIDSAQMMTVWFGIVDLDDAAMIHRLELDEPADFPAWSPTADVIAFHAPDGIRTVPAAGGATTLLTSNAADGSEAYYPEWSPDGGTLYYLALGPEGWLIRSVAASGGPSRLVVRFDDPTRQPTRYGFRVGGGRFFFTIGAHESDVWVAAIEE